MPNVNQLTLANGVFHHLMRLGAQHEPATQLVASAAFQVGFVRIAAGLARWSQEPDGHNEMQARLSEEQFDVLMLAPVDAAARSAVSCMDLCAAAAYRLTGAVPQPTGQESDVQRLRKSIKNKEITLCPSEAAWLGGLLGSAEWRLLMKVRTAVTHHSINSLSILGTGNPATSLIIDGKPYGNIDLCRRFTQLAERQFDSFTSAVISDFSLFCKLASRSLYTSVYRLHPATRSSAFECVVSLNFMLLNPSLLCCSVGHGHPGQASRPPWSAFSGR